jgi:hypothetical protein
VLVAERRLRTFADLNLRVVNVRQHLGWIAHVDRIRGMFRRPSKDQFLSERKNSGTSSVSWLSSGKSMSGSGILYDLHSRRAHFTA